MKPTAALVLLWIALITTPAPAAPNEHAPGMAKKVAETTKPDSTTQKPKGWLSTFFESIFDTDDEEEQPDSTTANQPDSLNLDEVYKTSENPDTTRPRYPPKQGIRIGCICMDNTPKDDVGMGACSGRGGVRYWLYKVPDSNQPVYYPTERHHNHPQELTPTEIMQLDAHNPNRKKKPDNNNADMPLVPMGGVLQLLIIIVLCTTVVEVIRQILSKKS